MGGSPLHDRPSRTGQPGTVLVYRVSESNRYPPLLHNGERAAVTGTRLTSHAVRKPTRANRQLLACGIKSRPGFKETNLLG